MHDVEHPCELALIVEMHYNKHINIKFTPLLSELTNHIWEIYTVTVYFLSYHSATATLESDWSGGTCYFGIVGQ